MAQGRQEKRSRGNGARENEAAETEETENIIIIEEAGKGNVNLRRVGAEKRRITTTTTTWRRRFL